MKEVIVAVTGASGAVYATRLLRCLVERGVRVHLTISQAGAIVIGKELGIAVDLREPDIERLVGAPAEVRYYHYADIAAGLSSGTCKAEAMVVVPCSMNTLGAIAAGLAGNLIERAAAVMLKEGRRLIVVPRETPLSAIHLRNMLRLSEAGACVLPAMPGFYHGPKGVDGLVDFIVGRILDQLGIENDLVVWHAE